MAIIQSTDLEARGLLNDQSSSLQIQGRWFKPGPAFTKSLRQTALEFCEEARSQGRQYLLIEFPTYLMAWRRIRSKASTQLPHSANADPSRSSVTTTTTLNPHSHQPLQAKQSSPPEAARSPKTNLVGVNSAFIRRCKIELAIYVGPMADLLTEQTLNQSTQFTPQQLIQALALHIPDAKAALAFQRALQPES